jgi:hypothetical protein
VPQPLKALRASESVVDWPAEQTVVVSSDTVPAEIARVQLDTGTRTRLGELGPGDRAGLQAVLVNAYRDNGRQYAYGYVRRVSVVFVATSSR